MAQDELTQQLLPTVDTGESQTDPAPLQLTVPSVVDYSPWDATLDFFAKLLTLGASIFAIHVVNLNVLDGDNVHSTDNRAVLATILLAVPLLLCLFFTFAILDALAARRLWARLLGCGLILDLQRKGNFIFTELTLFLLLATVAEGYVAYHLDDSRSATLAVLVKMLQLIFLHYVFIYHEDRNLPSINSFLEDTKKRDYQHSERHARSALHALEQCRWISENRVRQVLLNDRRHTRINFARLRAVPPNPPESGESLARPAWLKRRLWTFIVLAGGSHVLPEPSDRRFRRRLRLLLGIALVLIAALEGYSIYRVVHSYH